MEFTTGLMSLDTALNEMLSRVTPLTAQLFIEIRTKESRASNRGGVAACVSKTTKCARFRGIGCATIPGYGQ